MKAEDYTVSGSIVLYNGFEEAQPCIASVLDKTKLSSFHLYLVDNASPDGTGEKLEQAFGARAQVLRSPENRGYGKGHNLCLPLLDSRYHAVINPDIIFEEDVLSTLCAYLDSHPDVVMVTPELRYADGRPQQIAKRVPNVLALISRQLHWKFLRPYEDYYLMRDRDLSAEQEIQFCTGCFFVVRTEALRQFGGFDPDYFMYVEDADITRRAMQYGRVMYVPCTHVVHLWHRAAHRSLKPFFQQVRSMLLYFRKWGFCFGFSQRADRQKD